MPEDDVATKPKENGKGDEPSSSSSSSSSSSPPDQDAPTPQSLVTEEHVLGALTADVGPGARLTAWKVVDFTKIGDNYACVVSSVEVAYELDGKSLEVVYVVKLNPCRGFESMKEFTCLLFQKEAKFYIELVPELNAALRSVGLKELNFPRCIYASLEKHKEIIFLKDLRPLGFKMADRREGLSQAQVVLALKELARFHAASYYLEAQLPNKDIVSRFPFVKKSWNYFMRKEKMFMNVFESQIKYTKEILAKVGGYERAMNWIDDVLPKFADVIDDQINNTKTKMLCHGDFWCNNMLFRYDENDQPVEVMLLDLQLHLYSSPAVDLNYMLYSSTMANVRRPNLQDFLSTYHSTFCSVLEAADMESPFTRAELGEEFFSKNPYGAIYAMVLLHFVIIDPEDALDLSTGTDDNIDQMLEESQAKCGLLLEKNPLMRPRFLSLFDDMMDSGVIP